MKNKVKLLSGGVLAACAFLGASAFAVVLEKPTANLTEHYNTNVGWGTSFSPDATAAFAGWTNESIAVNFDGTAELSLPKPQTGYLLAATDSSDGRFIGNYVKMTEVKFDVKVSNSAKLALYFKSTRGVEWRYKVNLPDNSPVGESMSITVPLSWSTNWSSFQGTSNSPDFAQDKANIYQFGFEVKRNSGGVTCTAMNMVNVDNVKLVGPWDQSLVNNMVPLAWLLENNLTEADADGYSNVASMLFGTQSSSSNAEFVVQIGRDDQGKPVVKWNDNKYVVFDLLETSDLNASFNPVVGAAGLVGTGSGREVKVDDAAPGAHFFKVSVRPAR